MSLVAWSSAVTMRGKTLRVLGMRAGWRAQAETRYRFDCFHQEACACQPFLLAL